MNTLLHEPFCKSSNAVQARPLLTRFPLFRTREIDQAREEVARVFCRHGLRVTGNQHSLECQHNRVSLGRMSLNFLVYGADVDIDPGCLESFYLAQIPVAGSAQIRSGAEAVLSDTRTAVILSPHRQTRMHWLGDCAQLLLRIPRDLIEEQEGETTGATRGPLDFKLAVSQERGPSAFWCRSIVDLAFNIESHGCEWMDYGAALASLEDFLLRGFLSFPKRDGDSFGPQRGSQAGAMPRYVHRAVDFIDANLGEPLKISDIARAACVGVRALEEGFRRHYDTTPSAFLRDRRLQHARHLLVQAARNGSPASVTEVAYRNGFFHLGRFSALYRERFGESPAATLRRS